MDPAQVLHFDQIHEADLPLLGKHALLARAHREGFPVPKGFVVLARAVTPELAIRIMKAYKGMSGMFRDRPVEVRAPETVVTVKGEAALIEKLKQIYAQEEDVNPLPIAVCFLPDCDNSGIAYTVDPARHDKGRIAIRSEGDGLSDADMEELGHLVERVAESYFHPKKLIWYRSAGKFYIVDIDEVDNMGMEPEGEEYVKFNKTRDFHPSMYQPATKLFVALDDRSTANSLSRRGTDGVVTQSPDDLEGVCHAFYPRPVIYSPSDSVDEVVAYVLAIRRNYNNLWIALPNMLWPGDLSAALQTFGSEAIFQSDTFKVFFVADNPVHAIETADYFYERIDGVIVDGDKLAEGLYQSALNRAIRKIVKITGKRGLTSILAGEKVSYSSSILDKAVSWGVNAVAVNTDAVSRVAREIAIAERKLML